MRILLYAQHLSGVGHYVRTHLIACHLAGFHDVLLVEGGRPVPRRPKPSQLQVLELPRIVRCPAGLEPLEEGKSLAEVMARRGQLLRQTIADFRPEALLIEHYPFSKWELQPEIDEIITAARAHCSSVKIVCSLRDVVFQTRHEAVPAWEYRAQVLEALNEQFDLVIVHGDQNFLKVEDSFGVTAGIRPPIRYSGIVSEPIAAVSGVGATAPTPVSPTPVPVSGVGATAPTPVPMSGPFAILSIGGGSGHVPFVERCIEAWKSLSAAGALGKRKLLLFAGLAWDEERVRRMESLGGDCVEVRPFSTDFPSCLKAADLVICHAGYNTCANILETRARALLVPDPQMSDQRLRAERLAGMGIVQFMEMELVTQESLAEQIRRTLEWQPTPHRIALDGAEGTRRILEQ